MVTIADIERYEKHMFDLINQSRKAGGLPEYTRYVNALGKKLDTVARDHSDLMMKTDPEKGCSGGHQCPGELDDVTRIRNLVGGTPPVGENVAGEWALPTLEPLAALDRRHKGFMDEGPGPGPAHKHYENIMSSIFQHVGVGVAFDGIHIWVTEDFLKP